MKINVKRIGEKGDTLIEAVLALAVIMVIITGIVTVVISSVNSSSQINDRNFGLNYAQEGMDALRDKIKTFPTSSGPFSATYPSGYYCLGDDTSTLVADTSTNCPDDGDANLANNYLRTVYIGNEGNDPDSNPTCASGVYVSSIVKWTDAKCMDENGAGTGFCHKVELDSCFYDTNALPTM